MLYQSCNVACRGDALAAAAGVQVHPHDPTLRMLIVDGRRSKHCGCCCWLAPHCGLACSISSGSSSSNNCCCSSS